MNKLINLTIGALIYFVPAIVIYKIDKTGYGVFVWLTLAWSLSILVILYLEQ
jgi:hypothetical protein